MPPFRILVTTEPFGTIDPRPLELVRATGWEYVLNETGRTLTEAEMLESVRGVDGIIAGTEPITARVLDAAPNLKIISRVGVGLDSVDLVAARRHGVAVSYTPEAPAPAVSELAIGMMIDALRAVSQTDRLIRGARWSRYMGRRLEECVVGVVGVGRIGKRVIRHLSGFGARVIANDLAPDLDFGIRYGVEWVDKWELLRRADIVTLHLPLTPLTRTYIGRDELAKMRAEAVLVNTARGPLVDLQALEAALRAGRLGAAALDVFDSEPYTGPLASFENVIMTCHMGSCSRDCRARMEIEATEECVRFLSGHGQQGAVPEEEYEMRQEDVRYVITVRPDATFHHLGTSDVLASGDPRFRDYRRRWYESPSRFRVEPFPLHLDIEVVGPADPGGPAEPRLIDFETVRRVLDEGAARGLCGVKFGFRGDPLAHPRLPEMIAYAKDRGVMDVYLKAEAVALHAAQAASLIQAGLDRVTLTVPVRDRNWYRTYGPESEPAPEVAGVESLLHERERHGAHRPRLRVQTYLTDELRGLVDVFADFWRARADEVAYVDLDYAVPSAPRRGTVASWACAKPWQSLCVTWNGVVLPCNHDFKGEEAIGHVGKDALADVWQGKRMSEIRHAHSRGEAHTVAICDACVLRACEIGHLATRA